MNGLPNLGSVGTAISGGLNSVQNISTQVNGIAQALTQPTSSPTAMLASAGTILKNVTGNANAQTNLVASVGTALSSLPSSDILSANGVVPGVVNQLTQGAPAAVQAVAAVGKGAAALVGNVSDNVSKLISSPGSSANDLLLASSKLGIDFSSLSRLSPNLQSSLVTGLKEAASLVPGNTNVKSLLDLGVSFSTIDLTKFKNLPAVQQAAVPSVPASVSDITPTVASLIGGNAASSSVASAPTIANIQTQVSGVLNQVNSVVGGTLGITNGVGTINQNSLGAFNPASVGLGSVESNLSTVAVWAQSNQQPSNVGASVTSQYGSNSQSPLANFVSLG